MQGTVNKSNAKQLLSVCGLGVRYGGGPRALSDVSFDVERGEIVAILGANGAGKTTALRAISGLLGFHGGIVGEGEVFFKGDPLTSRDAPERVRLGIAQVMEGRRIFGEMSVADNLAAGAYTRSLHGGQREEVAASLDEILGLFPILKQRLKSVAGYLSGGEQQMLAIGRALMAKPVLLLLDEPSLGIAPKVVEQIVDILRLVNQRGVSIVLVEQNASIALGLCRRAIILETGKVAAQGFACDLQRDPIVREIYMGLAQDEVGGDRATRRSFRRDAPARAES